ncbi:hypothetical protein NQ314_012784 [Rhamnusium bicolor]|uniref:DDE Tnp4 domain-containing protein n=1 Tax=Rhamnusium bicolor TaxID=1586634 RepID=A0AAV8XAN0_9CUCU|nr:hypothetical protein NQ314_012784 [Rhamnusium bicolor]
MPFKDDGHLTRRQKNYNLILSKSRVVVENIFPRFKGIIRRFKYLHILELKYIKYYIVTACILHNMLIQQKYGYDDEINEVAEDAWEKNYYE